MISDICVATDKGKVQVVESTFKWTINSSCISDTKKPGNYVESPLFTTMVESELKWRLWFYPKGYNEDSKEFVSVFLTSRNDPNVLARFSLHLFSNKEIANFHSTSKLQVFEKNRGLGKFTFCKRSLIMIDQANDVLINDSLTIICKIHMDCNVINTDLKMKQNLHRRLKELERLEKLVDNKKFSDVTFNVGGAKFSAHKNILAMKSQVFEAMFEHDMKENAKNEVDIEGINREVFKEMLRFMYAGKVNGIENIADQLLIAANRIKNHL